MACRAGQTNKSWQDIINRAVNGTQLAGPCSHPFVSSDDLYSQILFIGLRKINDNSDSKCMASLALRLIRKGETQYQ